jgi:hypothetical protein
LIPINPAAMADMQQAARNPNDSDCGEYFSKLKTGNICLR